MAHLAVVSSRPVSARRSIPWDTQKRIKAMPCAVCGLPYFICVDHIVPVACGGDNVPSNLQPLCRFCNGAKGHRLTNRDIAREIARRGKEHFLRGTYLWHTRMYNCYDGPGEHAFFQMNPDRVREALAMHAAFIQRVVTC